jgi:muramoyltetrapeptide carboxypeptidase
MAAAFNDEQHKGEYVQSIKKAITGKALKYRCAPHEYNKTGTASGKLVGGNLALLAHVLGTPSDIKTAGNILFIEDIGEYIYSVDRMFYHLKRAGKLEKLGGLVIGGFTDMKDTVTPFGQEVYEVIYDVVKDYSYPVCFQFPVGHMPENYALKIGVPFQINVSKTGVALSEVKTETE